MSMTTEVAPTAVHAPGTDIAAYQPQAVEEYRARFVMSAEEAGELDRQLRECMRSILVETSDYGTIPGMGDKPSLFKPGAEKLIQWFGFGFDNVRDEIERDADGNRVGVTYKCTVHKELPDGRKVTVATCEGYAGYDEDKFFVSAEANERKERHNAQRYERSPNTLKFAEYRAPWNSVIKMAQKRSLVGAAIDATAAAGLFTQDLEDMRGDAGPTGEQFATAAEARVNALAPEVRNALVRWYRGQRWPAPAKWSPERWCEALQVAGALAVQQQRPEPPPTATATATAVPTPEAAAEETWLDGALAAAPGLPTVKACQELWRESAAKVHAGEIEKADAQRVQEILRARMADLRQAPVTTLDDDDPWAVKIEALISSYEAGGVLGEVFRLLAAGHIDEARAGRIAAAITARFPDATAETAVAA